MPPALSTVGTGYGKTEPARRRLLPVILVAVAVVAIAIAAAVAGYSMYLTRSVSFGEPLQSQLKAQLGGSSQQSNNILVAAVSEPRDRPYRTDSLVLIHLDPQGHRVWQLWIPAGIATTVASRGTVPVGEAHLYGGAPATIKAVRSLTGLPIAQYAEVDAQALRRAVDSVGGLWLEVPPTPGGSASDTPAAIAPGWQRVTGETAVTIAVATQTVDPDYSHVRNQGLVLATLMQALSKSSPSWWGLLRAVSSNVRTTLGLTDLASTLSSLGSAGSGGVYSAVVTGTRGTDYVTPDTKTLSRLVADIRGEKPFDVPGATLDAAAKSAAIPVASKKPSQVSVTVNNGAGLSGAAKQAAGLLQTQGFVIKTTGNANLNVYKQTLVVYKTDPSVAYLVAQYLPPGAKVVRSYGLYAFDSDILVVIGKDWDITKAPVVPVRTQ